MDVVDLEILPLVDTQSPAKSPPFPSRDSRPDSTARQTRSSVLCDSGQFESVGEPPLENYGYSLLLHRGGDLVGRCARGLDGVAHRHGMRCPGKHFAVVVAVSDSQGGLVGYAEFRAQALERPAL